MSTNQPTYGEMIEMVELYILRKQAKMLRLPCLEI